WLSTGIMDCLIRALAGHDAFSVVSRQTVASALQASSITAAGISRMGAIGMADQVGASYLVSGSIERAASRVRLNCELTDLRRGTLLRSWSKDVDDVRSSLYPTVEE